jgi:chromosome segregation ATPase
LVPARRHTILVQQLHTAEQRVKKLSGEIESLRRIEARNKGLSKLVDETREQAREWKKKVGEAEKRVQEMELEMRRHTQRIDKLETQIERTADTYARRAKDLDAWQSRLGEAERDLTAAREHLMTIEVKLDILEGAANVLDGRMRHALAPEAAQTSAPR